MTLNGKAINWQKLNRTPKITNTCFFPLGSTQLRDPWSVKLTPHSPTTNITYMKIAAKARTSSAAGRRWSWLRTSSTAVRTPSTPSSSSRSPGASTTSAQTPPTRRFVCLYALHQGPRNVIPFNSVQRLHESCRPWRVGRPLDTCVKFTQPFTFQLN